MSHLATANFALLLGMCVVTAAAGVFVWLRLRAPGARVLALLLFACALDSGAFGLEFATTSLTTKVAFEKLLTVSAATIPTLWFVFALQYTGRSRYLTRTVIALLAVVPVMTVLVAASNEAHHLFWRDVSLAPGDAYLAAELVFGPAYWAHIAYSNVLLAAGTVLLLQLFWRSWSLYRGQAILLLVAVSIPWLAQSMYLGGSSLVLGVDLVSVAFCFAALLLAVGFGRLRASDVLSVSRAAVLDSLVDAVTVLDPDANVLYSNPAGAAFLKRLGPEAIPEALAKVWPQAFDARTREPGRLAERATISWTDAAASVFDLSVSPVVDRSGQAVAKLLVVRDVTERRRAETALRESEARFRAIFEENRAIKLLVDPSSGAIVEANSAAADFYGYSREQLLAMNVSDINVLPADALFDALSYAATEQLANFAFRHRLANGDVRDVEVSSGPIEERGRKLLFAIVQDVTAQKQATRALQHSAALLSRGESLAHLGSWEWDLASDTYTVSEEWQRLHGLAGERFSNEEILLTCHEDDREAMKAALARAAAGEPCRIDHRIVRPATHEVRHLTTYGDPVFDAEGHLQTLIGASLDVTHRVRADEVLHEREERLRRALADTVAALGATVAMRDPYTASHERRVSELACKIAERLNWSVEAIERLRIAALVHDVGKIAVPAEILSKPSRLTEMELELIKAHSAAAYEILASIDFGGPVAEIVLQHHERLDGSGYPQGLSGDGILPGARLLAVADVVEAMITHRPYRAALPLEEAMAEIEDGAGSRYDAAACETVVRLFREEGFAFGE